MHSIFLCSLTCPSTPLLIASYYGYDKLLSIFVRQKSSTTEGRGAANFAALEK